MWNDGCGLQAVTFWRLSSLACPCFCWRNDGILPSRKMETTSPKKGDHFKRKGIRSCLSHPFFRGKLAVTNQNRRFWSGLRTVSFKWHVLLSWVCSLNHFLEPWSIRPWCLRVVLPKTKHHLSWGSKKRWWVVSTSFSKVNVYFRWNHKTSWFGEWSSKTLDTSLGIQSYSKTKDWGVESTPQHVARWWFHFFKCWPLTWGRFPLWLIFFKWVETTNEVGFHYVCFSGDEICRYSLPFWN